MIPDKYKTEFENIENILKKIDKEVKCVFKTTKIGNEELIFEFSCKKYNFKLYRTYFTEIEDPFKIYKDVVVLYKTDKNKNVEQYLIFLEDLEKTINMLRKN